MLPLDHGCMGFPGAVKTGRESDINGDYWNGGGKKLFMSASQSTRSCRV